MPAWNNFHRPLQLLFSIVSDTSHVFDQFPAVFNDTGSTPAMKKAIYLFVYQHVDPVLQNMLSQLPHSNHGSSDGILALRFLQNECGQVDPQEQRRWVQALTNIRIHPDEFFSRFIPRFQKLVGYVRDSQVDLSEASEIDYFLDGAILTSNLAIQTMLHTYRST
jgi:hypothetical protein